MIRLDINEYDKLTEPLSKIAINNLFAKAVIERRVSGSVYVDNTRNPRTFYIVHPYGMSLLFGESNNNEFNDAFKDYILNRDKNRTKDIWMQAYPADWDNTLDNLLKEIRLKANNKLNRTYNEKVEINTRVNFKFNLNRYKNFRRKLHPEKYSIKRSDKSIYSEMQGSVVPCNFWDNEDDFIKNAIGFSLYVYGRLATTAFSAFLHDTNLELGMETKEEFRGKGYAQIACSALIDYCLENNYEPVWACRLENVGSYKLALKLGFEEDITIPYYKLRK